MYPGTHAGSTPDKAAYIMGGTGRTVTYKELDDRSNQLAQLLYQRGLRRGDGMALCMENNDTFFPVTWAGARSGLYYTAVSSIVSSPPTVPALPPAPAPPTTAPVPTRAPAVAEKPQATVTVTTLPKAEPRPTVPRVVQATAQPAAPTPVTPAVSAARDYAPKALRAVRDLRLPMGISGLVLAFLAVQGRIDRRDPRLVFAPVTADEDVLTFS